MCGQALQVSFYICLIVMAVCNRKVKGSDLVGEHERSLQELFPMEAPSLLAYVETLGAVFDFFRRLFMSKQQPAGRSS